MVRTPAGTGYGYRIPGIPKNQCVKSQKCYSENAGILGILSSGAARNKFLPVQSNTFGCAKELKMLGFVRGARRFQRAKTRPFTTKNYGTTKSISSSRRMLEKKKLRRFILITAVKFYSEMKTPTQKKVLGCDSSLSLSNYRLLVNPNLLYDKTYQQQ